MMAKDFKQVYLSLDDAARMRLLAQLAYLLTIDARDTYVPQSEELSDPARLRSFTSCNTVCWRRFLNSPTDDIPILLTKSSL